jgi:branched-chain amino acid aminotransferase
MNTLWCNGQWRDDPAFPATDRGVLWGLGLFETILAAAGRPVFVERHLERLRISCARWGWDLPDADFPAIMAELLERRGLVNGRARLRLALTAGSGPSTDLTSGSDRLVLLTAAPCDPPPERLAVCVSPWPRNERSALAGLKCSAYAENIVALDHARRSGFDETIFFNTAGNLCEAAMANVFIVSGGKVLTPPLSAGCLPGIARQVVLENTDAEETTISAADFENADEVFLTSATRGPVPVSRIGGREMPVHSRTREITKFWEELVVAARGGAVGSEY